METYVPVSGTHGARGAGLCPVPRRPGVPHMPERRVPLQNHRSLGRPPVPTPGSQRVTCPTQPREGSAQSHKQPNSLHPRLLGRRGDTCPRRRPHRQLPAAWQHSTFSTGAGLMSEQRYPATVHGVPETADDISLCPRLAFHLHVHLLRRRARLCSLPSWTR